MLHDVLRSLANATADDSGRRLTFVPGEILIREGEHSSAVLVLLDGSLTVERMVKGNAATLAHISEPGSVVGEMVTLGGGVRSATVTALTDVEVMSYAGDVFHAALNEDPDLASQLVDLSLRRAYEGELVELLSEHFGVVDGELLMSTCGSVEWVALDQGDTLVEEGDPSDGVFFVVRGRLEATRFDPVEERSISLGEAGRGDVVGEMGLLREEPRSATLTALRNTVVAKLGEGAFFGLVDRQPRLMVQVALNAVTRAENAHWPSTPGAVLSVASTAGIDRDWVIGQLVEGLETHGKAEVLSRKLIESRLDAEGAADVERGGVGDIRLSRLIHEVEMEADYLILDSGDELKPWARRAAALADHAIVVAVPDAPDSELSRVAQLSRNEGRDIRRFLALVHPAGTTEPNDTARIMEAVGASDVVHLREGSHADSGRLARVVVGRGNSLVLGGGGARGFAHIGVFKALGELGFPLDIVGGTSIGGVIGTVLADGWELDRIVELVDRDFPRAIDYTLPIVSLAKGERFARSAESTFGDRQIEDLWNTYFCVSTNLSAARIQIHRTGSITHAVRATSAIPGVLPPVPRGSDLLVDGGVLNNLPMDVAREMSPLGSMVAVDVAPPRGPGAHGNYGLSVSGWQALRSRFGSSGTRYPRMAAVLMRSMISASMHERDMQTSAGLADCYLSLDMRGVSMLDFAHASKVVERGYDAAMPALEEWMAGRA